MIAGLTVASVLLYSYGNKARKDEMERDAAFSSEFFQKKKNLSFGEKLTRFVCSYGFSGKAIESIRSELIESITFVLRINTICLFCLTFGLFVLSFFIDGMVIARFLALFIALFNAVFYMLMYAAKKKPALQAFLGYLLYVMMCAVSMYAALVVTPDEPSYTIMEIVFIAPAVLCYKPYIITLLNLAMSFSFMDLCRIYKPESGDGIAFLSVVLMGIIAGYAIARTRITSIYLTKNLDNEVAVKTKQLNAISKEIVSTLTTSIESKDEYTNGHSERVADYASMIAARMGWPDSKCDELWMEAILHDIGKIGVPDSILKKRARLTDEEFKVIQQHTVQGARILENLNSMPKAKEAALFHHEKVNGQGYPEGLKGNEIPEGARIIAIADAYDAMTSSRCYRPALENSIVLNELSKGRGSQFDAKLLDVFMELLAEHGGSLIEEEGKQ